MNDNEFLILLQAKLDEAISKGNINSDIDKIQQQIDILKVQAEIDKESINKIVKQVESVLGQEITISNININQNQTLKDAQSLGSKTGQQFNQKLSHELSKSNNSIDSFKKSLLNAGKSSSEIDNIVEKVRSLNVQIDSLGFHESSNGFLNIDVSGLDELGNKVKITQHLVQDLQTMDWKVSSTSTSVISTKEIDKMNNTFADYTAKLAQFKSTNNNILSGLSAPLSDFESKLAGLHNGSVTIAEVKNSFKNLDAEASKILQNFTAQFNKADAAIRQIATGEETIQNLRAEFKGLDNAPKEINAELNKLTTGLNRIKEIESQEGRTVNWSAAYREWEDVVKSLTARLGVLKKEQANVASTQIFKTSDLRDAKIPYMTKVSNTIEKQMAEIQKMANAKGWLDFDVSGVEESDGKIKKLTLTVTEAEGAIKKLTFQRTQLQGKGKAQAGLMQVGDVQVIKTAAQAHEELNQKVSKIQHLMDNGSGVSKYQNQINGLINNFNKYGVSTEQAIEQTKSLQQILDGMKGLSGQELVNQADKFEQEFKAVKISVESAKQSYDRFMQPVSKEKASSLINRINEFLTKNTKITKEARSQLEEYVQELNKGVNLNTWNDINSKFKETQNSMRGLKKLGASLKDQMTQAAQSFTQWLSVSSAVMLGISKTKDAISELIELDSILTEISKTSDLTDKQLKKLGNNAFESASKYGRSAADYLTGVQEMYRAGFNNAEEMAELSLLAQAAGDMAANSANDYLMATNAAYNYKGSVEELNKVLDSQNYITNNAAVSMQDMADATSEAASIAAQYGVEIDELSALIAVATSKTRESGAEVGNALKSIFVTLQDTTSKPVIDAFNSVDISMTKIVDGSERLKTPIELLKELSDVFNRLPEGDTRRANILTDIGKKYHANTLSAILSDWESYESMLDLYSKGIGSAAEEAEKSANNIEGGLKRLGNTWTDTVENVINSDAILIVINTLNGLLSVLNKVTDSLGSLGTIGISAGLFAGFKNVGNPKMFGFSFV